MAGLGLPALRGEGVWLAIGRSGLGGIAGGDMPASGEGIGRTVCSGTGRDARLPDLPVAGTSDGDTGDEQSWNSGMVSAINASTCKSRS